MTRLDTKMERLDPSLVLSPIPSLSPLSGVVPSPPACAHERDAARCAYLAEQLQHTHQRNGSVFPVPERVRARKPAV